MLYVPGLRVNFISIGKITEQGYDVVFKKDQAFVKSPDGIVKTTANKVGDLYYVVLRERDENLLETFLWQI